MSLTTLGLIFDIAGFILVFTYGGFDLGRPPTLLISGSESKWGFQIFGAILVIVGFILQLLGNLNI